MDHPHLKRRLKAILLADVVGYSRLMNVDEAGTHVRVANYTNDLIEPKIADARLPFDPHHGRRVSRRIRQRGRCGFLRLEIQKGLRTDEARARGDRRIRLRIGINTGDVIADDHDIYGNSVNIAARLEGFAEPG